MRTLIPCDCGQLDHLFAVEQEEDTLLVSVMLNHYLPWWKRLWLALSFIRGKETYRWQYTEFWVTDRDNLVAVRDQIDAVLQYKQ